MRSEGQLACRGDTVTRGDLVSRHDQERCSPPRSAQRPCVGLPHLAGRVGPAGGRSGRVHQPGDRRLRRQPRARAARPLGRRRAHRTTVVATVGRRSPDRPAGAARPDRRRHRGGHAVPDKGLPDKKKYSSNIWR